MKNPFRQIEVLQQALSSDKSRNGFLLGAGCPYSIKLNDGVPLIKNIEGLTKTICSQLDETILNKITSRISKKKPSALTIEDILTQVRLLAEVVGNGNIDGLNATSLEKIEKDICTKISSEVDKEFPNRTSPYHKLVAWIKGIQRNFPVEIFTPNYDLLIEAALESQRIPYFDGFVGSKRAFFDLHAIEHESLPARWARLWKLHGSINWWSDDKHSVFRGHSNSKSDRHMIYPSHQKYDQSRRMPYLAMQDQLGRFLATGQSILVTSGYSFVDQHLNEIIMQRLSANPRATCFGLLFGNLEQYPDAIECAKRTTNFTVIASDGAYIAGQKEEWDISDLQAIQGLEFCIEVKEESGKKVNLCKIGDFDVFGHFLLNQIGVKEMSAEVGLDA